MRPVLIAFIALLWAMGPAGPEVVPAESTEPDIRAEIRRRLATPSAATVDGASIESALLHAVYAPRGFAPLWTAEGARSVVDALHDAATHGLDPEVYHVAAIERRLAAADARALAERDLLLSDGVMRFARDLRAGRVAPGRWSRDVALEPRVADPVELLLATSLAADPRAYLESLAPASPVYQRLRAALARYREVAQRGGWPAVPDGPSVEPGARDAVVPVVRRRLELSGELPPADPPEANLYDTGLVSAVKAFQARHGLAADGVIGRRTRAALAVPVEQRIAQIVANLERWRWLPDDLGRRYVRVNVPAYWLEMVEEDRVTLEMPVVVGRPDRPTPLLASRITQLVFNPSWTVPQRLAREDMLPKARRNPGYFAAKGIRVYGGWGEGAPPMDSGAIDWAALGSGIAGLKLRQPPGPGNPLGRVKFHMPNGHDVYLHDTNAKGLMSRLQRAESSGCVRLGDALGLAYRLLGDWTPERRAVLTRSWRTQTVSLGDPIPVYLLYETVWADTDGALHFREDVYGRDAALVKALESATRRGRVAAAT